MKMEPLDCLIQANRKRFFSAAIHKEIFNCLFPKLDFRFGEMLFRSVEDDVGNFLEVLRSENEIFSNAFWKVARLNVDDRNFSD